MKHLLLSGACILLFAGCDRPESAAIAQAAAAGAADGPATIATPVTDPTPTTNVVVMPPSTPPLPGLPPSLPVPAREVVKLAHGQMGDGVVTNFIANITEPFHLDADQIVYLRDIGLSPAMLESLLAREQQLARLASENVAQPVTAPAPVVAAATATETNTAPATLPTLPTAYPGGQPELAPPQVGPAVAAAPSEAPAATPTEVNYNFFYDSLSPYGNWFTVPSYGTVWQPSCAAINPGWRPYWNDGCWNYSDAGWYWNSSYSWGWAPFHYGNWVNAPGNGWCWVPGRTWAPSWVTFRYGGGYCGWAPLPPGCGWSTGVGLTWAGSGVGIGFGFGFSAGDYCWTPTSYFTAPNCYAYGVYGAGVNQIYNGSSVVNNYVVGNNNTIINNGIDPGHIAPHSRNEIRKVQLADVNAPSSGRAMTGALGRPGDSSRLAVYRPTVGGAASPAASTASRGEVRPSQFANRSSASAVSTRIPGRPSEVTQPDRMPAPNPRTPAVALHSGSGGSSSLSGRTGAVRPGTSTGSSLGAPSRPAGVRNPEASLGPNLVTRGGTPYAPSNPTGRLEPRKVPSISDRAPGAGVTTPGAGAPPSRLTPQGVGVRPQVGTGRPLPGSIQPSTPRTSPRPAMPSSNPGIRPSQGPQMQRMQPPRMQAPPSVNMSRPVSGYNAAPARGGTSSGGGGNPQRPGR